MIHRRRLARVSLCLALSALLGLTVLEPSGSVPRAHASPAYTASEIAAGSNITCAITSGNVRCFGDDTFGRLGMKISPYTTWGNAANQMGRYLFNVSLGTGRTATQIAVGANHGCALLDNGAVKCWGDNSNGQLGVGDTQRRGTGAVGGYNASMGDNLPAVNLGSNLTVTRLRAGGNATCAILDDSSVTGIQSIIKCWGMNGSWGRMGGGVQGAGGDLGDSASEIAASSGIDVGLTGAQIVTDLAMGEQHTCVLISNGDVKCWGGNSYGQLGKDNTNAIGDNANEMGSNLTAINLGTDRKAISIAAGRYHTCAVLDVVSTVGTTEGEVKCWGQNDLDQLGGVVVPPLDLGENRGDAAGEMADLPTVTLSTGRKALSVAAGYTHTCVVLDDNSVRCWGTNDVGQAGRDNTTPVNDGQSTTLGVGTSTASLALGYSHSCALASAGTVKCWGRGGFGQIGQGNGDDLGNSAGEMAALSIIDLSPYIAPIALSSSTPSNGATGVSAAADFVFTFDQAVTAASSKNIRVTLMTSGTTIETIAATNTSKVSFSAGGTTVTVNPSTSFSGNTWYCVEIDSGAFENTGTGAAYGGLSSSALCYRTAVIPPSITTRVPAHNATGVAKNSNIELTYDQILSRVAGNQIEISERSGTTFETMFVTNSSRVSIDGPGLKVTINPMDDFEEGTEYCVIIPAGAFIAPVTNATTAAIAIPDYCFTTAGTAPGGSSGSGSSGGSSSSSSSTSSSSSSSTSTTPATSSTSSTSSTAATSAPSAPSATSSTSSTSSTAATTAPSSTSSTAATSAPNSTVSAGQSRSVDGPTVRSDSATITFTPKTDLKVIESFEFSIDDRETWDEADTTTLDDGRVRFTVTDLTPATNYDVIVRAVTTNGRKIVQAEVSFRTKAELPSTGSRPGDLMALVGVLVLLGFGLISSRRRLAE